MIRWFILSGLPAYVRWQALGDATLFFSWRSLSKGPGFQRWWLGGGEGGLSWDEALVEAVPQARSVSRPSPPR